jgi:excisionase family DNA binding protein
MLTNVIVPYTRTPSMPEEAWITIAEAAAMLRLHPETIRRAVRAKELKAVRFGYRTVRIARVDLEAWLKSKAEKE